MSGIVICIWGVNDSGEIHVRCSGDSCKQATRFRGEISKQKYKFHLQSSILIKASVVRGKVLGLTLKAVDACISKLNCAEQAASAHYDR